MATKVAVIMGGTSFERNFSLLSGRLVSESLARSGFDVLTLDADAHLVDTLRAEKPDVAFICMHGAGGEDGAVPALLEFLRIPYVGSRPASCRAAWNKADMPFLMRRVYGKHESLVVWPPQLVLPASAFKDLGAAKALDIIPERLGGGSGFPLAVKPVHGGSAMGLSRVDKPEDLGHALMGALAYDDSVIIQHWVEGVEVSVTVLGTPGSEKVLPPVEIEVKEGIYDTDARLETSRVNHFCPVRDESLAALGSNVDNARVALEQAACEVYRAYDCRDFARVDFIWDGHKVMVMGLKTFPGLTETSLVPMAIEAAGLKRDEVLAHLVVGALERGN